MDHYYSASPSSKHNEKIINYSIANTEYKFKTDAGVFSRKNIDFGTNLLLHTILKHERPKYEVIDLGCGYGVVGVVMASKNTNNIVHMVDINERAVKLSLENANLNNIKNVNIYQSNLLKEVKLDSGIIEVIVSNPPIRAGKELVWELIDEAHKTLTREGRLWLVVKKSQGAPSVHKKLKSLFCNVSILNKKGGYFIFCAMK